jgi:UDP:flavonoid glycosyltransferase YjiC (YdhE family)
MMRNILWPAALLPVAVLVTLQFWDPKGLQTTVQSWISGKPQVPIFVAAIPGYSHVEKMAVIAEGLMARGHKVIFITGYQFKEAVEKLGADFEPLAWSKDIMDPDTMQKFLAITDSVERETFALDYFFLSRIPVHQAQLETIFTRFQCKYGANNVPVLVYDGSLFAVGPVMLGAPGIRPSTIGIGHFPVTVTSNDTFPYLSSRAPDTSKESKQIHHEAQLEADEKLFFASVNKGMAKMMQSCGATKPPGRFFNAMASLGDRFLHAGMPDFEYPRSDLPPSFEYIGPLPSVGLVDGKMPDWWDEILAAHKQGKKIVAVTSSSVEINVGAIVIPALEGLKGLENTLVVATLVNSEPEQMEYTIPANARVAKFIPLHLLLPYVSQSSLF